MRRIHALSFALLALSLSCTPVLARTAPLPATIEDDATDCPDAAGGDATVASKPTNKRSAPPATTRSKPGAPAQRGNGGGGAARAPRWHRFIPGMFR